MMCPWNEGISMKNQTHLISTIIAWISMLNIIINATEINHNSSATVLKEQQRMFGGYDPVIPTAPKSQSNQDIDYNDNWPQYNNRKSMVTPKFMASDVMSMQGSSYGNNHPKYADYFEKDYDHFGGNTDEYFSSSHDNLMPHYSHPPYSMIVKQDQSMSSKLSNLISIDALKIILILILKLLLIKLKAVGFMKLLILILIKLPIVFFGFIAKILMLIKLANFFKLLALPLFLPVILLLLAPFLLPFVIPLLFLPLLLPLLLFFPIPILTITTTTTSTTSTTTVAPAGRRRRRYIDGSENDLRLGFQDYRHSRGLNDGSYYSDLLYFKYITESEQCLERIACKLAADKRSSPIKSYVIRILETAKTYLERPKLHSYVSAYKFGATMNASFAKCVKYYPCSKFKT